MSQHLPQLFGHLMLWQTQHLKYLLWKP